MEHHRRNKLLRECSEKYYAAKESGILNGETWPRFLGQFWAEATRRSPRDYAAEEAYYKKKENDYNKFAEHYALCEEMNYWPSVTIDELEGWEQDAILEYLRRTKAELEHYKEQYKQMIELKQLLNLSREVVSAYRKYTKGSHSDGMVRRRNIRESPRRRKA